MPGIGSGGAYSGYVDRPGTVVVVGGYGTCGVPADRLGYYVIGSVSTGVARVVVTWPGVAPVTAALDGPYFAARATFPGMTDVDRPGQVDAYAADGTLLGSDSSSR
jgi:hypothetical protein